MHFSSDEHVSMHLRLGSQLVTSLLPLAGVNNQSNHTRNASWLLCASSRPLLAPGLAHPTFKEAKARQRNRRLKPPRLVHPKAEASLRAGYKALAQRQHAKS